MQLQVEICRGCDKELPIVNRRHKLCDGCNFKRLHDGKSKEILYSERRDRREGERSVIDKTIRRDGSSGYNQELQLDSKSLSKFGVTKASKLTSISSSKRYRCSDGSLVSQVDIKRKLAEVYDIIKSKRPAMCEGSGRWDVPLSFSHTISQDNCKKLGKSELIWDEGNIELEGFEPPTSDPKMAHNIWEVGRIEKRVMLLNFERKLLYIQKHDQEGYNKLIVELDELERRNI